MGYSPRVAKSRTRLSDFTFTFTFLHVVIQGMKSCPRNSVPLNLNL